MTQDYRVLLYYQYVPIENGEQFAKEHLAACKALGIKGRILVADEGINGTVAGDRSAIDQLHKFLLDEGFTAMEYKESLSSEKPFRKMKIKLNID